MEAAKYYMNSHPIFKNMLEVHIPKKGNPYVENEGIRQDLDISEVSEWIDSGLISTSRKYTIKDITSTVCRHLGVNKADVFIKTRKRDVVNARQIIQYFCKEFDVDSLTNIGFFTGLKSHCTVLYSHKAISDRIDSYKRFNEKIELIKSDIV